MPVQDFTGSYFEVSTLASDYVTLQVSKLFRIAERFHHTELWSWGRAAISDNV